MDIKLYWLIKLYRKMSDNFNTSTVVKTCTVVGAAFGLSLYLYFGKGGKGGKGGGSVKDDEGDDEEDTRLVDFPELVKTDNSFLERHRITVEENDEAKNVEVEEVNVEEVNDEVKSCLHYDLYNKLDNEQKTQKKELLKLGDIVREAVEAVGKLQSIVSSSTISTNVRLQKLEMKNPDCSFFDETSVSPMQNTKQVTVESYWEVSDTGNASDDNEISSVKKVSNMNDVGDVGDVGDGSDGSDGSEVNGVLTIDNTHTTIWCSYPDNSLSLYIPSATKIWYGLVYGIFSLWYMSRLRSNLFTFVSKRLVFFLNFSLLRGLFESKKSIMWWIRL